MKLLSDLVVGGKRVFVRADLDVDLTDPNLSSSIRLTSLKPTVEYLLDHGAVQVFIAGHIDRPKGREAALSTRALEKPLEMILKRSVTYKQSFSSNKGDLNTGDGTLTSMAQLILFENLRFWSGEEANDPEFARQLASLGDVYINEAFGVSHRPHASVVGVAKLLPHGAGLHFQDEIEELSRLLRKPQRPFLAIIGGAKIETKAPVVTNLAKIADWVIVGGGLPIEVMSNGLKYPGNVVVAKLEESKKDIDQATIGRTMEMIGRAKTIVWNGPMGVFEEGFEAGTMAVAEAISASGAYSVVGGGETAQFLSMKDLSGKFSFVSAGGGAMLEFLAGYELPGITALE